MRKTPTLLHGLVLSSVLLLGPAAAAQAHCHNKVSYVYRTVKDPHRVAGTAIGAVAGAIVGHQIGGGRGKDLATVGGAVAGGVIGHKVQRHHQQRRVRVVRRVCS